MDKELEIAFNSIPLFSDQSLDTVTVERLGGLTNRNFLIATSKGKYVLRLAGEGTDEYIDRIREKKNAEVAVKAGVNAEILFFDEVSGTMVTRFIDNAVTMDIDKFKDAGALERTGQAFRKLHQSPDLFEGSVVDFSQTSGLPSNLRLKAVQALLNMFQILEESAKSLIWSGLWH